jgi:hypothetical protein
VDELLRPATDRDWSVPAAGLEQDCWHTAEHIGDTLMSYAAQLVTRPDGRYVRFMAGVDADATAAQAWEFAMTGGHLLVAAVRVTPPTVRAYHPSGQADPAGFAGMGCVEVLLHGDDIARALGLVLEPPAELCERVLARMFPSAPTDDDPWSVLRWATGRADLPDRARPVRWRWHAEPL